MILYLIQHAGTSINSVTVAKVEEFSIKFLEVILLIQLQS